MNIQSFVAALFLLMVSVSTLATPINLNDLTADASGAVSIKGAADVFGSSGYSSPSFAHYIVASVDADKISFEKGQYINLDSASSKSKNIKAIEPNSLYILVLGLLALFYVRRNQAKLNS